MTPAALTETAFHALKRVAPYVDLLPVTVAADVRAALELFEAFIEPRQVAQSGDK